MSYPSPPTHPQATALRDGASSSAFKFDTRQQVVRDAPPCADWHGPVFQQGPRRHSLREFQDAAVVAAARRFGGLHGCLPARTVEVRACVGGVCGRRSCKQGF